ncbi:MAG TPA: HisA/HisF-related TIM barrel protein [Vicinamibacterales bacterium]|nr:HisA/HisF-related TIM barrel protein [Vicinamibacterales bacterium]
MRVIGVIDLRRGQAVHARAGQRDLYQPVQTIAGTAMQPGDAVSLARFYVERLGVEQIYVADLDALGGGAPQDVVVQTLAAIGAPLLLDAGVTSIDRARTALALGAGRVVVALETLPDFETLRDVCAAIGGDRVAFSLDLRNGQPIVAGGARISSNQTPAAIARQAQDAGASVVIAIDLARVGTGSGLDLDLLADIRRAAPRVGLVAGGGVRDAEDLMRLAEVGCEGALVATALQGGRIGAAEIAAAASYRSVSR